MSWLYTVGFMKRSVWSAVAAASLAACIPAPALAAAPGTNVLVSRPSAFGPLSVPTTNDSTVTVGDEDSARVVSDDLSHRYVAFMSDADGLSDADDDSVTNVFVRDRQLNLTILVSRADGPAGAGADGSSSEPSISANGRFVAFQSLATNLAPGATGAASHVYVRDLIGGATRLVDRADNVDGVIANDASFDPSITVVGGNPVVAFTSAATNLDGATGNFGQVYVRASGDTEMVSRPDNSTAVPGNGSSADPSISTDGLRVAFDSSATNLVMNDNNMRDNVFMRVLASNDTLAAALSGNGDSRDPSLSGNGNFVAFTSTSDNLSAGDTGNTRSDVYRWQFDAIQAILFSRETGMNGAVGNRPSMQPSISDDGNIVVFASASTNLAPTDTNGVSDVFRRSATFTTLISAPAAGIESDGPSVNPSISRNPINNTHLIAFTTAADNMGADDENDFTQVYGRASGIVLSPNPATYLSRPTSEPFRSGVNFSHLRSPERSGENPVAMSQDGRFTVFLSAEDDLSAEDGDRFINVFRRDNLSGDTVLVSRADGAAGAAADGTSGSSGGGLAISPGVPVGAPSISADGNRIAFSSAATNLVSGDANALPDVFVRDVAAGSTVLASRDGAGAGISFPSGDPAISGDGLKVAFVSRFEGDPLDGNNASDVYLRDLGAGTTTLVSRKGAAGPSGNDGSGFPAIDADGGSDRVRHRGRRLLGAVRHEHGFGCVGPRHGGRVGLPGERHAARERDGGRRQRRARDQRRRQPDRVLEHCHESRRGRRRQRRYPRRFRARHGGGVDVARQPPRPARTASRATAPPSGRRSTRPAPDRVRVVRKRPRPRRRQRRDGRALARYLRGHDRAREPWRRR